MKNERGFFTIIGLCLLLAVAISIRGVQEFEGNYSIGAANSLAEFELQNAAESALIEMIETGTYEKNITSERLGKISVEVRRLTDTFSRDINRIHTENGETIELANRISEKEPENATIFMSVASCDSPQIKGKIYRKSLAYILDDDKDTVHFLNDL